MKVSMTCTRVIRDEIAKNEVVLDGSMHTGHEGDPSVRIHVTLTDDRGFFELGHEYDVRIAPHG